MSSQTTNPVSLSSKPKENKFREKCAQRRKEIGLILMPQQIENKIYRYKKKLRKENLPEEQIREIIRKTRRKAEKRWKRSLNSSCFRCRQPGHKISECPQLEANLDNGIGVCYNCGAADHKIYQCKKQSKTMDYVTCFICNEKGHITRNCPQNSRGVYPKGGCCKKCSSINHLIKDCPDLAKKEEGNYFSDNHVS